MKRWCVAAVTACTLGLLCWTGAQAQTPEPRPASTVQQVMQAILFPNSNVIFAAQVDDPATLKRDAKPSASTNAPTGLYGGWQAVENSGLALAESADLLNVRGRLCSNGTAVPVDEAEWKAAVKTLRDAALAVTAASRARNQDGIFDVTEKLTDSCSNCHRLYRRRENLCASR